MIINYSEQERDLLARIMRAEALSEGDLGMLMVGNVVVNRCLVSCLDFKNIRSLTDAIYAPKQFSGVNSPLFEAKPTAKEKGLANKVLQGERFHPGSISLWFCAKKNSSCSSTWYSQELAGDYKNHCFYKPKNGVCQEIC